MADLTRWFVWSLAAVVLPATAMGAAAGLAARSARSSSPRLWCHGTLAGAAFLLGLAGTTVYSPWADVLVLTSTNEGSPNVVKEALACNLPVVAVDVV